MQAVFMSYPAAGPPLSVEKTITELSYKPVALSASRTCKEKFIPKLSVKKFEKFLLNTEISDSKLNAWT